MYQALYRKWRPKTFDDVVGQKHITETLKNQVSTGKLSHAYLFIGTRGTGKTTCAKILAKAVNCENPVNGNPCNQCRSCRGIEDGSVMDVVEMDAASNNGVDNVRALRDEAVFSPASVKKRVYIIDEVHMLSSAAFNALLKILEEPPEHLMFILATTELQKVPATILSRCQRHSFKRLDLSSIMSRLDYVALEEGLDLHPDACEIIARLSDGGMRDALSLLDQCSGRETIDSDAVYSAMGLAGKQNILLMLRHIVSHRTADALELFSKLWDSGKDPASLLGELSVLLRDILILSAAPKSGSELLTGGYDSASLLQLSKQIGMGEAICAINTIQASLASMKNGQARTISELCLITLCEPSLGEDLPLLREHVARLEKAVAALSQGETPLKMPPDALSKAPSAIADDEPPFDLAPSDKAPERPGPAAIGQEPEAAPQAAVAAPVDAARSDQPGFGAASPVKAGSDTSWEGLSKTISPRLPVGAAVIIGDPTQASGVLEGEQLDIFVQPGFPMKNVSKPEVIAIIAKCASEATGRTVLVSIKEMSEKPAGSAGTAPAGKIDELGKFGIVSFK